jgi:hypothetical protein
VNPIVHGELSWLVSQPLASKRDRGLVTLAGLVPDIDGLSLLGGVDAYATYHHLLTHGLVAAAVTALGCAALARDKLRTAGLALVSFHLHVVCDLAGSGPGWPVLYFWPMSRHEWMWAWQWDLASWQNSVIGMLATLACLAAALVVGRTPLELVSERADAVVTGTIRRRFGRTA